MGLEGAAAGLAEPGRGWAEAGRGWEEGERGLAEAGTGWAEVEMGWEEAVKGWAEAGTGWEEGGRGWAETGRGREEGSQQALNLASVPGNSPFFAVLSGQRSPCSCTTSYTCVYICPLGRTMQTLARGVAAIGTHAADAGASSMLTPLLPAAHPYSDPTISRVWLSTDHNELSRLADCFSGPPSSASSHSRAC